MKNYYSILGIPPDADDELIKSAYRKLSSFSHPDTQRDKHKDWANQRQQELNEAYSILNDPLKRKQYDEAFLGTVFSDSDKHNCQNEDHDKNNNDCSTENTPPGTHTTENESPLFRSRLKLLLQRDRFVFILSLILISIAITVLMIANTKYQGFYNGSADTLGMVMGYSFWLVPISYFLSLIIFKRQKWFILLTYSVLLIVVTTYHSVGIFNKATANKEAAKAVISTGKAVFTGNNLTQDENNQKYGEMAPAVKLLNELAVQQKNDFEKMQKELSLQGIDTILTKQCLENAITITEAQERLKNIRQILDNYQSLSINRLNESENKIYSLDVSNSLRNSILNGYNKTKTTGLQNINNYFSLEKTIVIEISDLLGFLKRIQGRYGFNGEQITFYHQDDLNNYNNRLLKIRKLANDEQALLITIQKEGLTKIKDFEEEMKM